MCGIAGIVSSRRSPARGLLLEMAGELEHRGPDGIGLYLDRPCGMVNTRLAIIDLAGGAQPLSDGSGRYWVVQNGEIYNYVELRAELEGLGQRFATQSDTEVLAAAYAEWGPECLSRLNGDFAFAVWDRVQQQLFLARDRFGARPLYIAELDGDLVFASECKAILRHPRARRQIDPAALLETFTLWAPLPDRSAFPGIRELPPAHYLVAGREGIRELRRWWDLDFTASAEYTSEADAAEELGALLEDATRIRLRADVPVAAYVSGGLDSSVVAALARRHSEGGLFSFGVAFADARFDERAFQREMATALGTSLTQVEVGADDVARLLPRAVELWEKPTLRTAPGPLLALSEAVRGNGLKVVLTGEGADELFAGYDIFREDKVRRFWARDPSSTARPALLGRLNAFLARDLARSGAFLANFYGRGLLDVDDPVYSHRIRFSNGARLGRLLSEEAMASAATAGDPVERLEAMLPPAFAGFPPLGRAQYLEISTFLNAYLLHAQGDRMLMGNSVEGRFPYLDYRVAELAARLPDRMRLRGLEEKRILRRAAAPLVPASVRSRTKVPYRAPIAAALTGPGRPSWVDELLAASHVRRVGLLDADAVQRVRDKVAGRPDAAGETDEMALVGAASIMLLHDRFVENASPATAVVPQRVVVGDDRGAAVEPVVA